MSKNWYAPLIKKLLIFFSTSFLHYFLSPLLRRTLSTRSSGKVALWPRGPRLSRLLWIFGRGISESSSIRFVGQLMICPTCGAPAHLSHLPWKHELPKGTYIYPTSSTLAIDLRYLTDKKRTPNHWTSEYSLTVNSSMVKCSHLEQEICCMVHPEMTHGRSPQPRAPRKPAHSTSKFRQQSIVWGFETPPSCSASGHCDHWASERQWSHVRLTNLSFQEERQRVCAYRHRWWKSISVRLKRFTLKSMVRMFAWRISRSEEEATGVRTDTITENKYRYAWKDLNSS